MLACWVSLSTNDTVVRDTPARSATSCMEGFLLFERSCLLDTSLPLCRSWTNEHSPTSALCQAEVNREVVSLSLVMAQDVLLHRRQTPDFLGTTNFHEFLCCMARRQDLILTTHQVQIDDGALLLYNAKTI